MIGPEVSNQMLPFFLAIFLAVRYIGIGDSRILIIL